MRFCLCIAHMVVTGHCCACLLINLFALDGFWCLELGCRCWFGYLSWYVCWFHAHFSLYGFWCLEFKWCWLISQLGWCGLVPKKNWFGPKNGWGPIRPFPNPNHRVLLQPPLPPTSVGAMAAAKELLRRLQRPASLRGCSSTVFGVVPSVLSLSASSLQPKKFGHSLLSAFQSAKAHNFFFISIFSSSPFNLSSMLLNHNGTFNLSNHLFFHTLIFMC